MLCTKCGHQSPDDARFCAQCGNVLPSRGAVGSPAGTTEATGATAATEMNRADSGIRQTDSSRADESREESSSAAGEPSKNRSLDPEQTSAGKPPPSADPEAPAAMASEAQITRTMWLVGAFVLLAVAAPVVWLYTLYRDSTDIALSLPAAHERAPMTPTTPAVAVAEDAAPSTAPAPYSDASLPDVPSATPEAVEMPNKQVKVAAPATHISESRLNQLIGRLHKQPPPASCENAVAAVKKTANVSDRLAHDVALRAYPQLCAPAPATPAPTAPPAPRKPARSVDQIFADRSASECEEGLSGLICREKLRFRLCDGRWSANPPAGHSVCYVVPSHPVE